MKNFMKTEIDLFVCEECNKTFQTKGGICTHIRKNHGNSLYYDKWLKDDDMHTKNVRKNLWKNMV